MRHKFRQPELDYSSGPLQDHVHISVTRSAALLVLVCLILFAGQSIGQCAEPGIHESATSQVSTATDTENLDQLFRQCCAGPGLSMFSDLQALCQVEDGQACIDVSAEIDSRDRAGLKRDTWYFLGYQVATIGILYTMPESVTGWTDEQKEGYSLSIWWENVTHPAWDTDDFYINYLTHPYWGASYFVRARERGYSNKGSFWYSVLLSSAYEFGAEALFEEPSIQDLIVTPVFGSLLGKYFMGVRDDIREQSATRGYRTTKENWVWVLTDPLGSLNSQFDKLFGWDSQLQIRPYLSKRRRIRNVPFDPIELEKDSVVGLQLSLRW